MTLVAVVGGSGFIGRAVMGALEARGVNRFALRAPRLSCTARTWQDVRLAAERSTAVAAELATSLGAATHVVNCAGVSAASSAGSEVYGANSLLPALLGQAAEVTGAARLVHVSSSSVQGHTRVLSERPEYAPFSPYTESKVLGEQVLSGNRLAVVYRPTSVHGSGRAVTRTLTHIARSPFASVAGSGDNPSPQVLVENVADAICHLILAQAPAPSIVLHPSEGMTTAKVLTLLGGKPPRRIPAGAARGILRVARAAPSTPSMSAQRRRLEMLWFGQEQEESFLTSDGWTPVAGHDAWRDLGAAVATRRIT
jgi:UDP-glucose 4-epimerase